MIKRIQFKKLIKRLETNASVALLGSRQIGKTTLAIDVSDLYPSVYIDLEDSIDLQKISDFDLFFLENKGRLIILDEVQRAPEIFKNIRGIIDKERRKGNRFGLFLFLGSASIELLHQSSESLAGRISYVELPPISLMEFENINQLWLRGGYPDSILASSDEVSFQWRKDFIKTYLERDIPQLGFRISTSVMERLWTMLAHMQGSTVNASKLASNLGISNMSVSRYIDLLVDLLLVFKLEPYAKNVKKRLVKSPLVFIRDSGIVHALLQIRDYNSLLGNPVVGKSWEGFIIENVKSVLDGKAKMYFYRTAGGAEIDLLIEFSMNDIWAIEIKRGATFSISRGFYEACQDIKASEKIVVHGGTETYKMKEDVLAMSLKALLEKTNSY